MIDKYGLSELASVPVLAAADLSLEHAITSLLSALIAYGVRLCVRWLRQR